MAVQRVLDHCFGAVLEQLSTNPCSTGDDAGPSSTWLLVGQVAENEPLRRIAVGSSTIRVGRRPDCELHLPNMGISGTHAEITPLASALEVRDLGSTNGTFVNGVQITDRATVREDDIVQFSSVAFRVHQEACRDSRTLLSSDSDRALSLTLFDKLINDGAVVPHFQPIVRLGSQEVVGYEVLARSKVYGLTYPCEMFQAAVLLDMAAELSRTVRSEGIRVGSQLPEPSVLYLNTHPTEMGKPSLIESLDGGARV